MAAPRRGSSIHQRYRKCHDGVATEFSARFYKALASGAPVRTAYAEAQGAVQTRQGDLARGTYRSFVPEVVAERKDQKERPQPAGSITSSRY